MLGSSGSIFLHVELFFWVCFTGGTPSTSCVPAGWQVGTQESMQSSFLCNNSSGWNCGHSMRHYIANRWSKLCCAMQWIFSVAQHSLSAWPVDHNPSLPRLIGTSANHYDELSTFIIAKPKCRSHGPRCAFRVACPDCFILQLSECSSSISNRRPHCRADSGQHFVRCPSQLE